MDEEWEQSPAKIMTFIPLAEFENVKEVVFLHVLFYSTAADSCFSFPCVILGSCNTEALDVF